MKMRYMMTVAAVAATMACQSQAAEIELYGLIDMGFDYVSYDTDQAGSSRQDSLTMGTSLLAPNRWGMRGTEDLGNGWKAGFNLEGQFAGDTGEMTGGRLFHRTAQVRLGSDAYGTFVFGRSGALRSGFGTTGLWNPKTHPFSNSVGQYASGHKYVMPGGFKAVDNAITWQSPVWAGAQLHLQYSSEIDAPKNATGVENKDSANRYWGVGMTYQNGPVHGVAILDSIMYANNGSNPERAMAFSLEADYNFGFMTLFASGMYFDDFKGSDFQGRKFGTFSTVGVDTPYEGYSLQLGANIPAAGGTVKVNVGWMDAEASDNSKWETDRLSFAAGYVYPLSKRTSLYAVAGYLTDTVVNDAGEETNPDAYEAVIGIQHRF